MSPDNVAPPMLLDAYDRGYTLKRQIADHLNGSPQTENGCLPPALPPKFEDACDRLRDDVTEWFNFLATKIVPYTAEDRQHVSRMMYTVKAAIRSRQFYPEYRPLNDAAGNHDPSPQFNVEVPTTIDAARAAADHAMQDALRICRTAAVPVAQASDAPEEPAFRSVAFMLMWMDRERPELDAVHQMVKETFGEFGIQAYRADEIETGVRITDVVLEHIRRAEYLFADLSGERPNVYYELGYAHALKKQAILYRCAGTPLHFDLRVHNVPEYRNVFDLRDQLRRRLRAMIRGSEVPVDRTNETLKFVNGAREKLRAFAAKLEQRPLSDREIDTLILGSEGAYELTIQDEAVFEVLDQLVDERRTRITQIAQDADLGFGITLRCPPRERRLELERQRLHAARERLRLAAQRSTPRLLAESDIVTLAFAGDGAYELTIADEKTFDLLHAGVDGTREIDRIAHEAELDARLTVRCPSRERRPDL
jgi:hypothetical protein